MLRHLFRHLVSWSNTGRGLKKSSPGGHGPSSPDGPNVLLRGSKSAEIRGAPLPEARAGGGALRAAPPAPGSA
eukprot:6079053-Alexandrium_andersonii.AAC.1